MKNKKYEEDINLLEQIADLASKKILQILNSKRNSKRILRYPSKFQIRQKT